MTDITQLSFPQCVEAAKAADTADKWEALTWAIDHGTHVAYDQYGWNLRLGKLCHAMADRLGWQPDDDGNWVDLLTTYERRADGSLVLNIRPHWIQWFYTKQFDDAPEFGA